MTAINVTLGTPHIEVDPVTSQVTITLAGPQGPQGEPGSGSSGPEAPIHDLDPAPGPPNATDIIEGERDPGGTPSSEKLTWTQIAAGTAFTAAYQAAGAAAGGVLSGTYPNPSFAADMATQAELNAHESDTTSVHGITDTSALLLTSTGARVYFHSAGSYSLVGGRIFIGDEDPSLDGFTPANGDIWEDTSA